MFENLPIIESAEEFQRFADMGIRDFPPNYEAWLKMISDRNTESLHGGIHAKPIPITAVEYSYFCDLRNEERNLKSIERLVEERAAGAVFL